MVSTCTTSARSLRVCTLHHSHACVSTALPCRYETEKTHLLKTAAEEKAALQQLVDAKGKELGVGVPGEHGSV